MLQIRFLPARQGDAIWIRWGDGPTPHQLMIDMGTEEIGTRIRGDILALPAAQRTFELLVVTHVDRDHIGGVLTCLAEAEPIPQLKLNDVWFNGFAHLNGGSIQPTLEPMGPAQGERLSGWLKRQSWNRRFDGGPVQRVTGEDLPTVTLLDGLTLTVLGPTPQRLTDFIPKWKDDVADALAKGNLTEVSPGLEAMGAKVPPVLEDEDDLETLASSGNASDKSEANGSSISLLLEYRNRKLILAGDAFSADLVEAIEQLSGGGRLHIDVFKLPHHGSKNNVFRPLVEALDVDRWVFSTDGSQFRHPDPAALARIIRFCTVRPPRLCFNVPSKFNGWWDNDSWRTRFGYKTEYGTPDEGLLLDLG